MILRALCAFAVASSSLAAAETLPPNIVVIFCDDLGYGDIGCFGAKSIATPNLDRMASEGLRLTSFYVAANVCTPSRAGLLTGRYSIRMGLAKGVLFPTSPNGLPPEETTIAEMLKPRGYATACVGKWHLGNKPEFWPTRAGFDEYFGIPYSNDMNPTPVYRGEEQIEEPAKQETLTQRYTEEAVRFIEAKKDGPFFLYLAHNMPHIPLAASEKFVGRSKAGLYGDVVEEIDWSVGEVLAALKRHGLDEKTLVIFTSDNGPWYEGSAGPFRERKGESWEGGVREPFIARWPGRIVEGTASDLPIISLDLLPTFAAIAGAELPKTDLDGRDVSFALLGNGAPPADFAERPLYYFNNEQLAAVRSGAWKFVVQTRYINGNVKLGAHGFYKPGMLINLETDPAESFNLSRDNPEIVERMLRLLQEGRARFGISEDPPKPKPATQESKAE